MADIYFLIYRSLFTHFLYLRCEICLFWKLLINEVDNHVFHKLSHLQNGGAISLLCRSVYSSSNNWEMCLIEQMLSKWFQHGEIMITIFILISRYFFLSKFILNLHLLLLMSLNIKCQRNNEPTYVCFVLKIRVLTFLIRTRKNLLQHFRGV